MQRRDRCDSKLQQSSLNCCNSRDNCGSARSHHSLIPPSCVLEEVEEAYSVERLEKPKLSSKDTIPMSTIRGSKLIKKISTGGKSPSSLSSQSGLSPLG
jgi:hypothetical protein